VIGLGPGDSSLLAPMAQTALERAGAVVGYKTYLNLIDPELLAGKTIVSTGMTREMDRAAAAVDLAVSGLDTVVVSGGDAGVYGMAGLVLEMAGKRDPDLAAGIEVTPGIPALAAAAALLGAPLMHDFACVSLSDLLTDWSVIERRVLAAAGADFVLVLYNPASRRRTWQLPWTLQNIAALRGPDTVVGHVCNAFRPGQRVETARLEDFDPSSVAMLSILVVGNRGTEVIGGRMVTPRGYFAKYRPEETK
jgi:precorrin-3B C17-methyltransferase